MEYSLFTLPGCRACDELKGLARDRGLEVRELSLVDKPSRLKIRDYLDVIRRDDKGSIIIPTLIAEMEGRVEAVLNSREELDRWLKSRA